MTELLKVIEQNGEQIVSARDLHEFLEIGRDFSNWFKDRVEKYGFDLFFHKCTNQSFHQMQA